MIYYISKLIMFSFIYGLIDHIGSLVILKTQVKGLNVYTQMQLLHDYTVDAGHIHLISPMIGNK